MRHAIGALAAASIASLALAPAAFAADNSPLGLCPAETARLDGFMRAICDGERALAAGNAAEAAALFNQAAGLARLQATNELAWAGLAAAYCDARDLEHSREWAARFDEARRLWFGELSCDSTFRAQPQPFVRDHMCVDALTADYSFVRTHPDATAAREITARLQSVASRVEQHCAQRPAALPAAAPPAKANSNKLSKKKAKKKLSGRRASPARER